MYLNNLLIRRMLNFGVNLLVTWPVSKMAAKLILDVCESIFHDVGYISGPKINFRFVITSTFMMARFWSPKYICCFRSSSHSLKPNWKYLLFLYPMSLEVWEQQAIRILNYVVFIRSSAAWLKPQCCFYRRKIHLIVSCHWPKYSSTDSSYFALYIQ